MPDERNDTPPEVHLPEGPVRYAWFGGLLDGRRGDDARLRAAVARGNTLGLVGMDLDLDGGKFSVLFDDSAVAGEDMTPERTAELTEVLGEIVAAAADPAAIESTLRCTEVYEQGVVDTLFTPSGGEIECISRPRAIEAEDRRHAPVTLASAPELSQVGRRQALGLLALLLVAFGLFAWDQGLVDRLAAASAESLEIDAGPFGRTLRVEVESSWGNYDVTLERGELWPADAAAAQAGIDAAQTIEQGAAMRAVAEGGRVWLQLRAENGRVLIAKHVNLGRLLRSDEDAAVELTLPGYMSAHTLVLALDSGEAKK